MNYQNIFIPNFRWPRTLSMARALCQLQPQVKQSSNSEPLHPKTLKQEHKRKTTMRNKPTIELEAKFTNEAKLLETPDSTINHLLCSNPSQSFNDDSVSSPSEAIGDFPTPEELATLDAAWLADRCKLGYRAKRIVSLAQSIVNGKLQLKKLEELCEGYSMSSYDSIDQQLSAISGFGPFTRANVLMCMGFYHRIPADTETIRHIRQFHGRNCDIKSVQNVIEAIYGKYAPFQFLAYWSELWKYYEERFGTWSKLPASYYPLVTASNMKSNSSKGLKVKKSGE